LNAARRLSLTSGGNLSVTGTIGATNFSGTHSGSSSGTNTGDQTNISGNAATVTNATFYRQFTVRDDRSDGGNYNLSGRATGLYAIESSGSNGPGSGYLSLIHVANGTDVAFQIAGGYTSDSMYFRGTSALQNGTGYSAWRTVIHSGNIGSQTVATAGALSSMNISQFTNNSGYITSDSTKLPLAGGTMTGTITITNTDIRSNSTSNWTGDPGTQGKIQYHASRWYIVADSGSDRIVQFRRNGTDVSYIDNSGNFIGNASTATTAGSAPNASNLNSMYGVSTGNGNGLKFWGGSDTYKIHMGNAVEYWYGPVTDYSIKCNIDSVGSTRGFTWGQSGVTPIAALNVGNGNMQIAGTFTTGGSILPLTNNSVNLGSATYGWANVYTNDLHLSNMSKPEGNDIDGTNGTWTIQEGLENLYIINNNNGEKFKIVLEKI